MDGNAPGAAISPGANVIALLNSDNDNNPTTPFLAGTAANQIANLTSEDGADGANMMVAGADQWHHGPMDSVRWGVVGAGDVCERKSGPPLYTVPRSELVLVHRHAPLSRKLHRRLHEP